MNIQNQFQLRHLILLAGAALWGAATPVAAQDAPSISVSDATVVKPTGAGQSAEFIVTRGGDTSDPVTVGYRTQDGSAKAGVDYSAVRGVVTIPAGETSATIQVPVLPGSKSTSQNFVLQLTGASGPLDIPSDGTGSVLEAKVIDIGSTLTDIVSADFNSDGKLDLVGSDADGRLTVALNTSAVNATTPTFAPTIGLESGRPVIAADLNGDGKPDLVVDESGKLSVALNLTPDGASSVNFSTRTSLSEQGGPIAVADLNGDGQADLSVCNTSTSDNPIGPPVRGSSIFLSSTPPGATIFSFSERIDGLSGCAQIIATDLNEDGKADLVFRDVFARTGLSFLFALRNVTEEGRVVPMFESELIPNSNGTDPNFAVADFDGDRRPDLAVGGQVFVNTTAPGEAFTFGSPTFLYVYQATERVASTAGDFDADGTADLLFNHQLFLNTASDGGLLSFTKPIITNLSNSPIDNLIGPFNLGDFNGDGKPELIGDDLLMFAVGSAQLSKSQGVGTIQPTADTTPGRFSFIDRFGVARGQPLVSNVVLVRGINQPAPVVVNGGSYSINNGPYVTGPGLVNNGDRVRVALFSASQFNTAAHAQLSIGGVSDVFTTRTRGPLLDVFLSRLFGFDLLNQLEIAMAGFNAPAMP